MADEAIEKAVNAGQIKIEWDVLPLSEKFDVGRKNVQRAVNHEFERMSPNERLIVAKLLTKKSFNKQEAQQVRDFFVKYEDCAIEHPDDIDNVPEYDPVDYKKLDQATKQKILEENLNALRKHQEREAMIAEAHKKETDRAEAIAGLINEFSQNDQGETLANVHTCEGFQEVYDYTGSLLEKNKLERKKEQVSYTFDAKTHLFQKVYYAKGLVLDDERKLRNCFNNAKASYEQQLMGAQAAMFIAYWPLTYRLALHVKPVTLLFWTGAYCYGYNLCKNAAGSNLQRVINSAAHEFAPKYGIDTSDAI